MSLADVHSFLVAYPNGEVLDGALVFQPLPAGVHIVESVKEPVEHRLDLGAIEKGARYATVEFGPIRHAPDGRQLYGTKLRNTGNQRIRVVQFGAYTRRWWRWRLHTMTGGFFSAGQFRAWYGMGDREWLEAGQEAEDPDNYGRRPVIWAFYCRSESGDRFVTGGRLD